MNYFLSIFMLFFFFFFVKLKTDEFVAPKSYELVDEDCIEGYVKLFSTCYQPLELPFKYDPLKEGSSSKCNMYYRFSNDDENKPDYECKLLEYNIGDNYGCEYYYEKIEDKCRIIMYNQRESSEECKEDYYQVSQNFCYLKAFSSDRDPYPSIYTFRKKKKKYILWKHDAMDGDCHSGYTLLEQLATCYEYFPTSYWSLGECHPDFTRFISLSKCYLSKKLPHKYKFVDVPCEKKYYRPPDDRNYCKLCPEGYYCPPTKEKDASLPKKCESSMFSFAICPEGSVERGSITRFLPRKWYWNIIYIPYLFLAVVCLLFTDSKLLGISSIVLAIAMVYGFSFS